MLDLPGGYDDDHDRQHKFVVIANAMPGFGGASVEVRYGAGTVTWPGASPYTNSVGVTHGLGRTPVAVTATANLAAGSWPASISVVSVDPNTISFRGYATDDGSPATGITQTFYWIAIG